MNITTLIAAAAVGAGLAFVAPSADAMPLGNAPVDVNNTNVVEKVHGRHCRVRRGHRHCRRVVRRGHNHTHCHRRCHKHRHHTGHHHGHNRDDYHGGYGGGRNGVTITFGF